MKSSLKRVSQGAGAAYVVLYGLALRLVGRHFQVPATASVNFRFKSSDPPPFRTLLSINTIHGSPLFPVMRQSRTQNQRIIEWLTLLPIWMQIHPSGDSEVFGALTLPWPTSWDLGSSQYLTGNNQTCCFKTVSLLGATAAKLWPTRAQILQLCFVGIDSIVRMWAVGKDA